MEETTISQEQKNVFLIDWLTFTAHGCTVSEVKELLGLSDPSIPWQEEEFFRDGYPVQCIWNGITIGYGADDERYFKDPSKARHDMGISVKMSGSGCRAYESYGANDWKGLLDELRTLHPDAAHGHRRYNVPRLDLAYDDHEGLLDILELEHDVRKRNYICKSNKSKITWSDDQKQDIQGLNIQIGSDTSLLKIRIYDKAAERGFNDRHWVRVEMQLRDERANAATVQIADHPDLGKVVSGILRNYLTFRTPSADSNKCRWPIADYWEKILTNMEKISLWIAPGEEYNISKTEHWMFKQYGPAMAVLSHVYGPDYFAERCNKLYPLEELPPKYQTFLSSFDLESNGGT